MALCSRVLFALLVFTHFPTVHAQVVSGTIGGVVQDTTGGVLPGVEVTVTRIDTGATRTVLSNDSGRYRVPALESGTYQVRAELAGFQSYVAEGIALSVAGNAVVNLTLSPGEISEEVVVTADAVQVETTQASLEGLVDDIQIRELPLNGRSFTQLALLQEGVNAFRNNRQGFFGGRGVKFSAYGARFSQNSFLLDGTNTNDMYNNSPGSVAGVQLGVDTVEEFKVMTHNFSAEYGRAAGAVVNAVSRSGTNEIHGSIFEFHRNDNVDAKNYFDDPNSPIPEFKRNQFGFTLGGPIVKDKTFFFGSYEGLREGLGTSDLNFVPDENARNGMLPNSDTGVLEPVEGFDPVVVPYFAAWPEANGANLGGGVAESFFSFNQVSSEDYFAIKIDHNFGESDSFFVRYTISDGDVTRLPSFSPTPVFNEFEVSRNQYVTIEEKHLFSPTLLNSVRFGVNRSFSEVEDSVAPGFQAPPPFRPDLEVMGDIGVGGLTTVGTDFRVPIKNALTLYEIADNVLITKGNHSLKLGFLGQMIRYNLSQWAQRNGSPRFTNLRFFLQGETSSFTQATPGSDVDRALQQFILGFYVQDDFQWKPNFVWNLGFRYEPLTVPTERYDRIAGLPNPLTDTGMTIGPPNENPSLRNFMPRIGFAWDPFNTQTTSIRGGFGMFYDQITTGQYVPTISLIPPFFIRVTARDGSFPDAFSGPNFGDFDDFSQIPANTWTPSPFAGLRTPYLMHFNFTIDQEVMPNTLLRIGYAGSRGVNLARHISANYFTPIQILDDGSYFAPGGGPRVNPAFGGISLRQFDANSFFNSLFVKVNRRFSDGFHFQISYTLGKSIDDNSQINSSDSSNASLGVQNPFVRKADRGRSNHDIRQNATINFGYELPFGPGRAVGAGASGAGKVLIEGWQLNSIIELNSGNPLTMLMSGRFPCGCGPQRPDLAPGGDLNPVLGNPSRWYDPSAFEAPVRGAFGNVGRNTVQGPGLANVDLSLTKATSLGERAGLEFRAEFFNLLNHPNFGTPLTSVIDSGGNVVPSAGRVTNTVTTSRQIQFALKLTF